VPSLLDVRKLTIEFHAAALRAAGQPGAAVPTESLVAVRDLSFSIAAGEVLGLVGESGSGKSLTSLAILGLLPPQAKVSGQVEFREDGMCRDLLTLRAEQLRKLRGSRIAMIFQEPMTALNPVMRVGDQIAEAVLAHHAVSKAEARQRAVAALNDVALPDPAHRSRDYPYQLSGGMRQRVMIAMAIVNRPQLLIADEPTTALDVTIQAQILDLLSELRRKIGLTMLFISHDLAVVSQVADRVAVMYAGNLVELGSKRDIFQTAMHPYTRGLLRCVPDLRTRRDQALAAMSGTIPAPATMPPGCPFEPRCEYRIPDCARSLPPLVELSLGHAARCPVLAGPPGSSEPTLPQFPRLVL
jgi:oligopeptide/dipeptide ABC transporter ATP-binding protein